MVSKTANRHPAANTGWQFPTLPRCSMGEGGFKVNLPVHSSQVRMQYWIRENSPLDQSSTGPEAASPASAAVSSGHKHSNMSELLTHYTMYT